MILQIVFITSCFMIDVLLVNLLPHSFLPGNIVITPCLGLTALVLTQKKMERLDSLLITTIFGLLYDMFAANTFLICTISFVLVNLIVSVWLKHITDSIFENTLLVITTIFIKEFLVYFIMTLSSETLISFNTWLLTRAILTLLVNGIFVIIIVWMSRFIEDLMLLREKRLRKEETISWWKILSKQ